jgi:hypothetical protein
MTLLAGAIAVFFLGMGALALAAPERITAIQGQPTLTPDGRNEVRAVYGGFGVAMAAILARGLEQPLLRPGIFLTVAAALAGMALGRLVAAAVEPPQRFYPSWFFCALEAGMALALVAARNG